MRKVVFMVLISAFVLCLFSICYGEESAKHGSLQVISKTVPLKVYVDNEFKGKTPIKIENLQVGSHFVSVTSDSGGTAEAVVFEDLIMIREGELQTIALPLSLTRSKSNEPIREDAELVKKTQEYYSKNYGGWFLKLDYISSYYYNSDWYYYDSYSGSSIGYGGGYEFGITPNISLVGELVRADLSSRSTNWYIMPLTVYLRLETPGTTGVLSKNYYGLGLSYILTDLEMDSANQSSLAWGFVYGMEFPSGDKDAFFFDGGYFFGSGQKGTSSSSFYFGGGYKWGN